MQYIQENNISKYQTKVNYDITYNITKCHTIYQNKDVILKLDDIDSDKIIEYCLNNKIYDVMRLIDNIILNVNQIVSVVGKDGYGEINLTKLTEDKHKLIYTYLVKKYVLKK